MTEDAGKTIEFTMTAETLARAMAGKVARERTRLFNLVRELIAQEEAQHSSEGASALARFLEREGQTVERTAPQREPLDSTLPPEAMDDAQGADGLAPVQHRSDDEQIDILMRGHAMRIAPRGASVARD